MTEDGHRLYEGVLALDDVESGAIDLAGRFVELVDRLGAALDALSASRTVAGWAAAIAAAADALTATSVRDGWQRAQLQRLLDDVVEQAAAAATPPGCCRRKCVRCSPSACRAGRRARTSAPGI